jgi:hypothetical protein
MGQTQSRKTRTRTLTLYIATYVTAVPPPLSAASLVVTSPSDCTDGRAMHVMQVDEDFESYDGSDSEPSPMYSSAGEVKVMSAAPPTRVVCPSAAAWLSIPHSWSRLCMVVLP